MKSLIWKELRDGLKLAAIPILIFLLLMLIGITVSRSRNEALLPMHVSGNDAQEIGAVVAWLGAIYAGFIGSAQFLSESRGDRRTLLLHRPIHRTHIFIVKVVTGIGCYVIGFGVPLGIMAGALAADPSGMQISFAQALVPSLTAILHGTIYYSAMVLCLQGDGRIYLSRLLALATCFLASATAFTWLMPELKLVPGGFILVMVLIAILNALLLLAAWGAWKTGGEYRLQTAIAKASLAVLMFIGLFFIGVMLKAAIGGSYDARYRSYKGTSLADPPLPAASLGLITAAPEVFVQRTRGVLRDLIKNPRAYNAVQSVKVLDAYIPDAARVTDERGYRRLFLTMVAVGTLAWAAACFFLTRRNAMSTPQIVGWTFFGALGGVWALLMLLMLHEWPARLACPACGRKRIVTRQICEHCGAPQPPPVADGTEIFGVSQESQLSQT